MSLIKYFVDIFLAVLIMFVSVVMNFSNKQDALIQEYIETAVKDFTDNVSVHGYVSIQMYETFLNQLSTVGKNVDIDMVHEGNQHRPVYEGEKLIGTDAYYEHFYTDEMVESVYEKGVYYFEQEDNFIVSLSFQSAVWTIFQTIPCNMERVVKIRGIAKREQNI